jgi:hypothetical protein
VDNQALIEDLERTIRAREGKAGYRDNVEGMKAKVQRLKDG